MVLGLHLAFLLSVEIKFDEFSEPVELVAFAPEFLVLSAVVLIVAVAAEFVVQECVAYQQHLEFSFSSIMVIESKNFP